MPARVTHDTSSPRRVPVRVLNEFLEKQVAVDFSALQLVVASDNTKRFVVKTTKDELTNAPDFKTVDTTPSQAASDMSMSSSSSDQSAASSSSAQ